MQWLQVDFVTYQLGLGLGLVGVMLHCYFAVTLLLQCTVGTDLMTSQVAAKTTSTRQQHEHGTHPVGALRYTYFSNKKRHYHQRSRLQSRHGQQHCH